MKRLPGRRMVVGLLVILTAAYTWWLTRPASTPRPSPATPILRVKTARPGNAFRLGAVGLSTEATELSSGRLERSSGLVSLMRLLGPAVLRIGGSSVDASWWTSDGEPPPGWATNTITPADLAGLRGLLKATGWQVLLGVDLGHFEPARAADEARVARQVLGEELLGIEVGNEPNDFGYLGLRPATYDLGEYLHEATAYDHAVAAAAPGVAVYGPATTQTTAWVSQLGTAGRTFAELTQHFYGSSTCPGTPVIQPTLQGLLSPAERQFEDKILEMLRRGAALTGRPSRIGETNNAACFASPASPVFASALWALDWALRAGNKGVVGLNFHGNLTGVCVPDPETPICAPSEIAAYEGELAAQPEYYGLLAASRLEGGRFVPTRVIAADDLRNLTTWATLASDGTIRIALVNLSTGDSAQPIDIPMRGYIATEEPLIAPSPVARRGISLGKAHVSASGRWRPKTIRVRQQRTLRVVVPSASAMILTLRRETVH
jgi:hypothetical protein